MILKCQITILLLVVFFLASCQPSKEFTSEKDQPYFLEIPIGFPPMPGAGELTVSKVELGKKLFFETRLSGNGKVSCATCHIPKLAFSDSIPVSFGVGEEGTIRNAPSLANVGYQKRLFMEGGVSSLELQALGPLSNHNEMQMDWDMVEEWIVSDPYYDKLSRRAFDSPVTLQVITHSLAAFQRTIVSGNSRFDKHFYGGENVFSEAEKRGYALFTSEKTNCSTCHSGFLFSDQQFHNIGLYSEYEDEGRARYSLEQMDIGKFKTPSLRNVALTAPYMHDGSLGSLEEVVEHFNSGGHGHPNQSGLVIPLELTEEEKNDLILFLKTLTDRENFVDVGNGE